jgi:hypothetical protein
MEKIMIKDFTVDQLMEIVKNSTTDGGRLAPYYVDSFQLKQVIDELAERARMYEDISN